MKILPESISQIRVTWILSSENRYYFYRSVEGSIESANNRLDFDLYCTHGSDPVFTASLVEGGESVRLRFEGHQGDEDLPLRSFESDTEVLLCHESGRQVVYLHLVKSQ